MTRKVFLHIGSVAICLGLSPALVFGQRVGRWQYLGEANVDGRADHDKIKVGISKGTFTRIQNAAVDFDRVVVHYGDGQQYPVAIASKIPAGGRNGDVEGLREYEAQIGQMIFRAFGVSGNAPRRVK